jgi:hypothetical protein
LLGGIWAQVDLKHEYDEEARGKRRMRVASVAPRSVKSARSFFPVRRLSSLPIWRLVSVISVSVLRRRCFRVSTSARSGFRLASAA